MEVYSHTLKLTVGYAIWRSATERTPSDVSEESPLWGISTSIEQKSTSIAYLRLICGFYVFNFLFFEGIPNPFRRDKNSAGRNSACAAEQTAVAVARCAIGYEWWDDDALPNIRYPLTGNLCFFTTFPQFAICVLYKKWLPWINYSCKLWLSKRANTLPQPIISPMWQQPLIRL